MLEELRSDKVFNEIYEIMKMSFPQSEYRSYEMQKALLESPDYEIKTSYFDSKLCGFCAIYDLGEVLYIEHLATTPHVRGKGMGALLTQEVLTEAKARGQVVVLEVEPVTDEMTGRRVKFYERLGLHLSDYYHYQPALNKETKEVELRLMCTTKDLTKSAHDQIRAKLYRDIYQVTFSKTLNSND